MKCNLKGLLKMKMQGGETTKLKEVLYVPQYVKNLLGVSRLVSKRATMGDTQDKKTINKNDIRIILYTRKGKNTSMIFYLKTKCYVP